MKGELVMDNLDYVQKLNEILRKVLRINALAYEAKIYAKDLYYTIPYEKMNLDEKNEVDDDIKTIIDLLDEINHIWED